MTGLSFSQEFIIKKVTGTAEILNSDDKFIEAIEGNILSTGSLLISDEKSSVTISGKGLNFTLKGSSALPVSSIKPLTFNELLLALAMEDMIAAPRKRGNKSKNTAVYGNKEKGVVNKVLFSDDFGIKRLNGAVQLAENGFKESAIITSKEVFRKYPALKLKAEYRIYFAEILYEFGLYEESYDEFLSIKGLKLSGEENKEVEELLTLLNKKLVNN